LKKSILPGSPRSSMLLKLQIISLVSAASAAGPPAGVPPPPAFLRPSADPGAFRTRIKTQRSARPLQLRPPSTLPSTVSSWIDARSSYLTPAVDMIDEFNPPLEPVLCALRKVPYFRLYSVDMLASCEHMPQELTECYTESCEIYPVEPEDVPEEMVQVDGSEFEFEIDGWARWDMPTEDYYDTVVFPEEYTGYDGSVIWRFIHDKICFNLPEKDEETWTSDFDKAVSGLHAMISAQIVRGIEKKKAADDPEVEDLDVRAEFDRRIGRNGETPRARENMYFTYMLLLSACAKARPRLLAESGEGQVDASAHDELREALASPLLTDSDLTGSSLVGVASQRLRTHAEEDDGEKLWMARQRTRDLMRVMNCVQCNKCRLHGKIGVLGLSTALQILLGRVGGGEKLDTLHRVEIAALITTLGKFSTAIDFCNRMKEE